jgi:hypothetical protein
MRFARELQGRCPKITVEPAQIFVVRASRDDLD